MKVGSIKLWWCSACTITLIIKYTSYMVYRVNCREFETKRKLKKKHSNMFSCMKVYNCWLFVQGITVCLPVMMAIFQSKWSWRISNFYVTKTTDNLRNGLLEESCSRKFVCDKRNRLVVSSMYYVLWEYYSFVSPNSTSWLFVAIAFHLGRASHRCCIPWLYTVLHFDWLWPPIEPKFTFRGLFV